MSYRTLLVIAFAVLEPVVLFAQTSGPGTLLEVKNFSGEDAGSRIRKCILALPASGGTCDARGIEGALQIKNDPFAGVAKGGVLLLGPGRFDVSATMSIPSGWTIQGEYGGRRFAGARSDEQRGTELSWKGPPEVPLLRVFNSHHVVLRGLTIDGNSATGVVGILIDSDNRPATHHVVIEDFNIYRCLVGIQWGTRPLPDGDGYEVDKVQIFNGHVESWMPGSKGIVVQGANKGQDSKIEAVTMAKVDTGIDLSGGYAYMNIKNCSFGTPVTRGGLNPGIKSIGVSNLIIESGSSESGPPAGHGDTARVFIHVMASPYNAGSQTTVLLNTKVNEPILVEGTSRVLSIGNAEPTRKPARIVRISRQQEKVTVETETPHRLGPGGVAIIEGVTPPAFNGNHAVDAVLDATRFTFRWEGPELSGSGGTVLDSLAIVRGNSHLNLTSVGDYLNNGQGWTVVGDARVLEIQERFSVFPGDVRIRGTLATGINVVPFSNSPSFDASQGNTQTLVLTGDVLASRLVNSVAGSTLNFVICQDARGNRAFAWPSNFRGGMEISRTASTCSAQSFLFDGRKAFAVTPGATGMNP